MLSISHVGILVLTLLSQMLMFVMMLSRINIKLSKKSQYLLLLSLKSSSDLFLYYFDNTTLMLPSLQLWSFLPSTWGSHTSLWSHDFTKTTVVISLHSSPLSPIPPSLNHTAQHALLEDIKSLRPLGSTSSTGIRVFVTVFSSWRSVFLYFKYTEFLRVIQCLWLYTYKLS